MEEKEGYRTCNMTSHSPARNNTDTRRPRGRYEQLDKVQVEVTTVTYGGERRLQDG
jgi:hypothetical protein